MCDDAYLFLFRIMLVLLCREKFWTRRLLRLFSRAVRIAKWNRLISAKEQVSIEIM